MCVTMLIVPLTTLLAGQEDLNARKCAIGIRGARRGNLRLSGSTPMRHGANAPKSNGHHRTSEADEKLVSRDYVSQSSNPRRLEGTTSVHC